MAPVFRSRLPIAFMLTAYVAVAPAFAPEHLHERDEHHPNATVHRHLASHQDHHSQDSARLDDNDERVVWLTAAWLPTSGYLAPIETAIAISIVAAPAPSVRWVALALDESAPPHGPPRAPRSLRAPPACPRLI